MDRERRMKALADYVADEKLGVITCCGYLERKG